ncbi:uncharacterized protein LOC143240936 isoform X2 [Tachypleus tridentatus]|uniref:uncharacterized protein LOC143240936 isoform X2 n=1 Tax=Tachypleus tridentatus TaxID=6853 RepID=UPI003FCF996C
MVVSPTKDVKRPALKKSMHCVYFFGTKNYAWVLEEHIKPYLEFKEMHTQKSKSSSFKEAVETADDYVKSLPEKAVRTSELPSIEEEIATIFPDGTKKAEKPHRDYSRTPFLGRTKCTGRENDSSKTNSVPMKNRRGKQQNERYEKLKKNKRAEPHTPVLQQAGAKRTHSESSNTSSGSVKKYKTNQKTLVSSPESSDALPLHSSSAVSTVTTVPSCSHLNSTPSKYTGLLSRPAYVSRPITPPLDIEQVSDTLRRKNVKPSDFKIGFLGLGIIGQGIVKNLLNSGHHLTIWNRTPSKCKDFVKAGAVQGQTPSDVVAASDITFSCVSDPQAAKEMVFGNCGVLREIRSNKGYVEMTSIDSESSQDIAEAIQLRGGRYLEAPVLGSKKPAEEGNLIILAAGEKSLFEDCASCFRAMGKQSFFLGDIGNASKSNLILNMILGTTVGSLAEAMALTDRAGLSQKDLLEILELGSLSCPAVTEKGQAIVEGSFGTNMPLQHMQKDLRLALAIGDQLEQPLPLAATVNEVYKHAKRFGYGEHDVSAVYLRARF